jgi:CheY-like chemotaxis protein
LARKILLADDSVTAQNMGRKILLDAGYEVIAVNNGSAALKKIAELKPDLAILDVYMPGYSGLEVCQRLKESPETARIPVLLTVGKLEPFKPEEAKRVRAEDYIVKPFEASELLSALTKLEDKVVPRAEPSKPGRFARAIAAAEETSRGNRGEAAGKENGWKSRIGFPHSKTESEKAQAQEEKLADESSSYNPLNRDLRTVVETAAEKAAEKTAEMKRQLSADAEPGMDPAAPATPANLLNDVTPEEVAAIAAAVAKMQMSATASQDDRDVETASPTVLSPTLDLDKLRNDLPGADAQVNVPNQDLTKQDLTNRDLPNQDLINKIPVHKEIEAATSGESIEGNKVSELAAVEIDHRRTGDEKSLDEQSLDEQRSAEKTREESQDIPVTMAATAETASAVSVGESRWTAVAVALGSDEAGLSLEYEMQKAYAAAAPYLAAAAAMHEEAEASVTISSAPESVVDAQVAAISNPEPEPARPSEPVAMAAATETGLPQVVQSLAAQSAVEQFPVEHSDVAQNAVQSAAAAQASTFTASEKISSQDSASATLQQPETALVAPFTSEVALEAPAEKALPVDLASPNQTRVDEFDSPVLDRAVPAETTFANPEPANLVAQAEASTHSEDTQETQADGAPGLHPAPAAEAAQVVASSAAFAPIVREVEPEAEPKLDTETVTVKSTAAAWASWRQIRDTGKGAEVAQALPKEFDVPESAPQEIAAAVAAGAEQILSPVAAVEASHNPSDVASIVDSVLADLRPKLMEEISRKMSQKK